MSKGDGFRERAHRALLRARFADDPAARHELEKLAASYQVLADEADGMRELRSRYPNAGTDDQHVS
jgi:hypothetical protein